MTRTDVIARESLPDDKHYWKRLGEYWEQAPTLLVFLRHFGSAFAYDQAAALGAAIPELRGAGITTVLIGIGTPRDAAHFRHATRTQLPVLLDPALTIYRRLGLRQATSITPSDISAWAHSRHTRVAPTGRASRRQLGGSFLVDIGGTVLNEHRSSRISEITDAADIDRHLHRFRESRADAARID